MPASRQSAPAVGVYMTNGKQLIEIIESDHAGALGEDVCSHLLVSIDTAECCKDGEPCPPWRWRKVIPQSDEVTAQQP